MDLETIVARLGALPPAVGGERRGVEVWPKRLHVTRAPGARVELLLEGDLASFGNRPTGGMIGHGRFEEVVGRRTVEALYVHADDDAGGRRALAHVAYEAVRLLEERADVSNAELLSAMLPFLGLVQRQDVLAEETQRGLFAEVLLLEELLDLARDQVPPIPPEQAVDRWHGWDGSRRDFGSGTLGIEVKATASATRVHRVTYMEQFLPEAPQRLFVYSVGLKSDASGAWRLIDLVQRRVMSRVSDVLRRELERRLDAYGMAVALAKAYRAERAIVTTLPPQLYEVTSETNVLRPSAFKSDAVPEGISRLAYDLDISAWRPLSPEARKELLVQMLG